MTIIRANTVPAPPPIRPPKRYAWAGEETLVDKRRKNKLRQFSWFLRNNKWKLLAAIIITAVLFSADAMRVGLAALPFFLRIVFAIGFVLVQFVAMFWFLGRTRMYTIWPGTEGVSFADYRGQPELLEQARQIVTLLRGVKAFEQAGGEPLNGLLLEGPPGTGKTWLAQAVSTEAGVPFFYIDASSLNSMFMGIAPMKVGNLYRKARQAARDYGAAIIFIDEIDAIGSRSGVAQVQRNQPYSPHDLNIMMGMGGGNSGMLSTLLTEMSGFSLEHGWWAKRKTWFYKHVLRRKPPKPNKRVLTIGATNRIGALDPALLRPGRFDKKIRVDAPDMEGRRDIFAYYLSKMTHDESMDPAILASETIGYTPADIKYLLNESLRYALFDGRNSVSYQDFRRAQPEHKMGLRSPIRNLSREDKWALAVHEAGHAIAVRLFMPHHRIAIITVIRQGEAFGHVMHYPAVEQYEYLSTYEMLVNDLRVAVAGRANELEMLGVNAQNFGVGGDFGHIRQILRQMGFSGMFGPLGATMDEDGIRPTKAMIDEMEIAFKEVLHEVRMAMRAHKDMSEALVKLLAEKNELLADEVEAFFDQYGLHTPKVVIGVEAETAASQSQ